MESKMILRVVEQFKERRYVRVVHVQIDCDCSGCIDPLKSVPQRRTRIDVVRSTGGMGELASILTEIIFRSCWTRSGLFASFRVTVAKAARAAQL